MTTGENVIPGINRDHDDGDAAWSFGGLFTFKLRKADTNGSMSVMEVVLGAGTGPPTHIHPNADETYIVLEGTARFAMDGVPHDAGPGSGVFIPRGLPHDFRVTSDSARFYIVFTPAGFEDFFWRCGNESRGEALPSAPTEQILEVARECNPPPPTPEQFLPIATELGLEVVGGALQVGKD